MKGAAEVKERMKCAKEKPMNLEKEIDEIENELRKKKRVCSGIVCLPKPSLTLTFRKE